MKIKLKDAIAMSNHIAAFDMGAEEEIPFEYHEVFGNGTGVMNFHCESEEGEQSLNIQVDPESEIDIDDATGESKVKNIGTRILNPFTSESLGYSHKVIFQHRVDIPIGRLAELEAVLATLDPSVKDGVFTLLNLNKKQEA